MSRKSKQQAILKKLTEARMSERVDALKKSFFAANKKAETFLPPDALRPVIAKFNAVVPSSEPVRTNLVSYFPHREFAKAIMQERRTGLDLFYPEIRLKEEMLAAVEEEIAEIDAGLDLIQKAHESKDIKEMITALTTCQEACHKLEAALTLE